MTSAVVTLPRPAISRSLRGVVELIAPALTERGVGVPRALRALVLGPAFLATPLVHGARGDLLREREASAIVEPTVL